MAPFVEFFFLVLAIGASALSAGVTWLHQPMKIALYGFLVIVGSYLHLVIVSIIGGWLLSKSKRGK